MEGEWGGSASVKGAHLKHVCSIIGRARARTHTYTCTTRLCLYFLRKRGEEKTARYAKCDSVDVLHSHKGGGGEFTSALSRHLNVPCGLGRGTNVCLHDGRVSTKRRRTKRWTKERRKKKRNRVQCAEQRAQKQPNRAKAHRLTHTHPTQNRHTTPSASLDGVHSNSATHVSY